MKKLTEDLSQSQFEKSSLRDEINKLKGDISKIEIEHDKRINDMSDRNLNELKKKDQSIENNSKEYNRRLSEAEIE